MQPVRLFITAGVVFALATAAACSGRRMQTAGGDVATSDSTSLVVDNRRFTDMTIYVIEGRATRRRLGTITGMSKSRIALPRSLVAGGRTLQFLADPIGGSGNVVSHEIFVSPGDQVSLTIVP